MININKLRSMTNIGNQKQFNQTEIPTLGCFLCINIKKNIIPLY